MKPARSKPVVLITQGDHNGIGPEIVLKAMMSPEVRRRCIPVLVGSVDVLERWAKVLRLRILLRQIDPGDQLHRRLSSQENVIFVIDCRPYERFDVQPGKLSAEAGKVAGDCVAVGAKLCMKHLADALVTAPVSKEALNSGGYRYTGQTDMLAAFCKTQHYAMMLIARGMRVALATIHLPLRVVHRSMRRKHLLEKLVVVHQAMKRDFAVRSPKIAVLGLNPHAGENGLLGMEERAEIEPAVRKARAMNIRADGPFPADGFFGTHAYRSYDAVLAMYHDQGLIPVKMVDFERGVNFTAGLPIVRTSPDHGTAFDIAGKGIANPASMIEAIKLAALIVRNRKKG